MSRNVKQQQYLFERWLTSLKTTDPALHTELTGRLDERVATPEAVSTPETTLESVGDGFDLQALALETIVREGRPALLIRENRIVYEGQVAGTAAATMIDRLRKAAAVVEPMFRLIGRIDVENYPGTATYLGTGWLVEENIVVTNRHVAELLVRAGEGQYRFRPGRFGDEIGVSLDYRHEKDVAATDLSRVARVLWIESDPRGADIAFLEVARREDGTRPKFIDLAEADAKTETGVAVVGYPARAPAHIIPDQVWMDRIYGGTYDIKRIAPGLMGALSRGWSTHDCTTLGGNSGSVVLDLETGKAVALHFAGQYLIENYAVPASTIKRYRDNHPWNSSGATRPVSPGRRPPPEKPQPRAPVVYGSAHKQDSTAAPRTGASTTEACSNASQVSVTIPLTITVSLGALQTTAAAVPASATVSGAAPAGPSTDTIDQAARALVREHGVEGVYSIWPGYRIARGRLTDDVCLVVSAHPDRLGDVRTALPGAYAGFPVEIRPASIDEQMESAGVTEAPAGSISYNDADRTGDDFSFDWVEEEMKLKLHVGPERSWTVLKEFLEGTEVGLVSSIYEFHAAHIARAIERELNEGATMTLVLARQSRDPQSGVVAKGDFDRAETFGRWENRFRDRFDSVFVPLGAQGLVANSYHIKVTVRDGSTVWLSSGNWKRSSQPLIPAGDLVNPRVTGAAGNREWHVVIENETLARRFANHIRADYERSLELGGTPEAVEDEPLIDVPAVLAEAAEFEAAPMRVLEPLEISRVVRVKPLLTPDKKGAVFSRAVLQLIRSAKRQLLFQNQYIKMSGAERGFLKELVDALAEKAQELDDLRIILRSGDLAYDLSQLKRRGIDVANQVRILTNTHTKGIVVDGKKVLVGSHNWSSSGVTLNRDASLIFDDEEVAQYYAEAFEIDWERASEPRLDESVLEGVRPAEGAEAPSGFVRMTWSEYAEG